MPSPPDLDLGAPDPLLDGLPIGAGYESFMRAFAAALVPQPVMGVGEWARRYRVVSAESGSPYPGKWDPDLVPYLREIEDCVSFTHPSVDVWCQKSAQTGVTEVGLNLFGSCAHANAAPVLIVLPTVEEAKKYNKKKLQPTIDATEELSACVLDIKGRDAESSTALQKQYRGGGCVITGANSSTGLQMISVRVIIFEEISGYPADAGGRGDPMEQAESRNKAWLDVPGKPPKRFKFGTPDLKGACRISAGYALSDQRRFYVPCPHCGAYQVLKWGDGERYLRWRSATAPHGAFYVCEAQGCVIEQHHKRAMIARGVWLKTYVDKRLLDDGAEIENPDNPAPPAVIDAAAIARWRARGGGGRDPGFHVWQAYSPFVPWDETVAEYLKARAGGPGKLKVYWQQALGEPWEEKHDQPAAEKLIACREPFPSRRVPLEALLITGFADVQGDRLEWGVYAWGADLQAWLIDHGIIAGDPETEAPWSALSRIIDRTYEDAWGKPWDIDGFGVDSSYLSQTVYRFCARHAKTERDTRHVFACDGRAGWKQPWIGTPQTMDIDFLGRKIGACQNWPMNTFDGKSHTYAGLRSLLKGRDADGRFEPGTMHFNETVDRGYFEQLTAEHVVDQRHKVTGVVQKVWVNPNKRNEALDIAVGARALAHHFSDTLSAQDWQNLAARRRGAPEDVQLDLARLWAPGLRAADPTPAAPANAVRDDASPAAPADAAQAEPRRGRRVIASPYLH